jgi:hypothetical protein
MWSMSVIVVTILSSDSGLIVSEILRQYLILKQTIPDFRRNLNNLRNSNKTFLPQDKF